MSDNNQQSGNAAAAQSNEKQPAPKATKKPGPKVSMTAAQAKKLGLDPCPYGGK